MKVKANQLPADVLESIENPDPLQGEDVIIERDNGEILGAIIQPEAYSFFIKKAKENRVDAAMNKHRKGIDVKDIIPRKVNAFEPLKRESIYDK